MVEQTQASAAVAPLAEAQAQKKPDANEQTRQNLLRVGVLAAPAEALDDAGFELGLQLVVKGAGTFREFA